MMKSSSGASSAASAAGPPRAVTRLSLDRRQEPHYARLAVLWVLAITGLRLVWLAVAPAGLYPDEAQYWFWAQHPAWGYYSKPPLIPWLIALTTHFLGDGQAAIRLSAPLLHAAAAFLVYAIGTRLYGRRIGFWSALGYASLPGVSASAFLISTDAALLPLWALALYAFVRAREPAGRHWWVLVGIATGLGLLAKYAMAYWLVAAFAFVLLIPAERRHLKPLAAATALAIIVYLPNLWWNWRYGFPSYLHVRDNAEVFGPLIHPGQAIDFLVAQFGIFGPLFFAALIAAAISRATWIEPRAQLLAIFAMPSLAIVLAVALVSHAEPNWAASAYVSASVLVVAWALERGWRRALVASVALNLAAAAILLGGSEALAAAGVKLPARYDPLHRLRGWRDLGQQVSLALAAHPGLQLLADDRELIAALIYYVQPHPWDAATWDPMRLVKNQWDLTNDLSHHVGESYLIVAEHYHLANFRPSFAHVTRAGSLAIPYGPGAVRRYRLYVAQHFIAYPQDRH